MTVRVVLTKAAQGDVEAAAQWYEREQAGLGRGFFDEVGDAARRIGNNPVGFPVVWHEQRRALLRRFPYSLYFRLENDAAVVVACFHARRDPARWKARR